MFSDPAHVARDPFDDAALSLLWPGLGQFRQGRLRAGTYFTLETTRILLTDFRRHAGGDPEHSADFRVNAAERPGFRHRPRKRQRRRVLQRSRCCPF